jgi:hypothetical protein
VHIVNDERADRERCEVVAVLRSPVGEQVWRWQGDAPADSCVLVGRLRWTAPTMPGPLSLTLELRAPAAGAVLASDHATSRIL